MCAIMSMFVGYKRPHKLLAAVPRSWRRFAFPDLPTADPQAPPRAVQAAESGRHPRTTDRNQAAGCRVMRRTSKEVGVMPRETVVQPEALLRNPTYLDAPPPPDGRPIEAALGLSVGWNKIGWVQIHMFPKEWETTGDWSIVDLERADINALIRTLRKARDAAYGSDA